MGTNERRLDADKRELQQQRQEAELAGMKAQLAVQQQQQSPGLSGVNPMLQIQQSPGLSSVSPMLQAANPQLLGLRNASRLQVLACY